LKVAVGGQENHGRDLLVTVARTQPGKELVGNGGGVGGHLPRELERVAIGFGPASGVAGECLDRVRVATGPFQVGKGVGLAVRTTVGMRDDPAHLGSKRRLQRAFGAMCQIELEHRRGGAGQAGCDGFRPARQRLSAP
jgi:hypothetical protein